MLFEECKKLLLLYFFVLPLVTVGSVNKLYKTESLSLVAFKYLLVCISFLCKITTNVIVILLKITFIVKYSQCFCILQIVFESTLNFLRVRYWNPRVIRDNIFNLRSNNSNRFISNRFFIKNK